MRTWSVLGLMAAIAVVTACASESTADEASTPSVVVVANEEAAVREVTVTMSEYAFVSTDTVFTAGVPYRIVFVNEGNESHEWAVVPRGETDEANLLFEVEEEELPSGARVVSEFVFPEPGEYDFACFLPGHYEGGMVLPVRVE